MFFMFQSKRTGPDLQMTMLFSSLKARGLPAFLNFLHVLRETFHGWIADDIHESTLSSEKDLRTGISNGVSVQELINKSFEDNVMHKISEEVRKALNEDSKTQQPFPEQYSTYLDSNITGSSSYLDYYGLQLAKNHFNHNHKPGIIHKKSNAKRRRQSATKADSGEIYSNIAYAPIQLRTLQRAFKRERFYINQSIFHLKQEEFNIRALLKQNNHEHRKLISRQIELTDIEKKLKQIRICTFKLLHAEPVDDTLQEKLPYLP